MFLLHAAYRAAALETTWSEDRLGQSPLVLRMTGNGTARMPADEQSRDQHRPPGPACRVGSAAVGAAHLCLTDPAAPARYDQQTGTPGAERLAGVRYGPHGESAGRTAS